jgi:hypothetical protein
MVVETPEAPIADRLPDVRDEDAGIFKVMQGAEGWDKLNAVDVTRFASLSTSLVSIKLKGTLGTIGNVVGGVADVAADAIDIGRQRDAVTKLINLDERDIRGDFGQEARDEDNIRMGHAVGRGVAITGASMGTLAAVGLLGLTGPVGWIVGVGTSVVTGMLTSMGYDAAFTSSLNDSMGLTGKLLYAQMEGIELPPQAAFAAWAATQPKGERDHLESRLREITKGEVTHFGEALTKNKTEALEKLMQETDATMRIDLVNQGLDISSSKSAAEQLAEKMNTRNKDRIPEFISTQLIKDDQLEALVQLYEAKKAHDGIAQNALSNNDPFDPTGNPSAFPGDPRDAPGGRKPRSLG